MLCVFQWKYSLCEATFLSNMSLVKPTLSVIELWSFQ
uniref:Uncharacterized protein n=1 Tax=Anguilla anguilla TaxID=7936 RepID=A0A0E9S1C6_ANGAN